jgi:Glycosyltransferase family 87
MKFVKPDIHFLILCISAFIFIVIGGHRAFHASNDFVPVYTGARCLLHGCNPYSTSQLEQQFFQGGGHAAELPSWDIDVPVYPPSTFLVLSPLALLRFPVARLLWFLLNCCLFVAAAGLVVSLCPRSHRWLGTVLASYFLVTAGILLVLGQPATFAISSVVIASWLFLRKRLLPLGVLLFTLSLAVKPQIGGLIVLYFLVRRIAWRHAAVALAGAFALLLTASLILRVHPASKDWPTTLRSNLSATLSPGGSADPRPSNQQSVGDINVQTLTSIFITDARSFNVAAYGIFLALLIAGILVMVRADKSLEMHLLALGALSILSLTPVYHRFYDTRLLLLSVPAVVLVFAKRRPLGVFMAVLTVIATVSVQYRVQTLLVQQAKWQVVLANKFLFVLLLRQQNLELLILFCLYLVAIFSLRFSGAAETAVSLRSLEVGT